MTERTMRAPRSRALLATAMAFALGLGAVFSSAAVATAAEPKMTWELASTSETVLSGGTLSYTIDLECSNLDADACVDPELTITPPQSADGSVVAAEPTLEAGAATLTTNDDGSVTIAFDTLAPGQAREVQLTWRVPNYTVLPDTVLDIDGTLSYVPGTGSEITGVAPITDPDPVTTTASPAINVTKTMVDPTSADQVTAASTATYRLTVCLPGEQLGQLDYTHVTVTDSLDIDPVEDAGSEATFTELAGGTLSADGRSVTWDFDFTADNRPLCGTDDAIVLEVSVNYPLGMKPSTAPDGSVANRSVVNNLDAEATLITGDTITGHDEQSHTFSSATYTGRNHLMPYQGTPSNNADTPAVDPIEKADTDTEFRWNDYVNWGTVSGDGPDDKRAAAIFTSLSCMTNVVSNVPTNLSLTDYVIGGSNELTGIFADDASYTAPTLNQQCEDPAFRTNSVDITISESPRDDGVPGGHHDAFRVTVYYWDSATGTSGNKTVSLSDLNPSDTVSIPVYEASGFDLSDTQTVTDILAVGSPTEWDGSHWALRPVGVQSDSFAASDYMAMTNHFISYLSGLADDGTLASVGDDDAAEVSFPTSRTKTFVSQVVIPSVLKTSSDDLTKLTPGDVVHWTIEAGNSDLSDTTIKPTVYDVLPTGLEYVSGSAVWSGLDGKAEPAEEVGTITVDGVERQKITWTFDDDFAPGETATVSFETNVTIEAPAGSHSNDDAQFAAVLDQDGDIIENLNASDVWDLDGDGNTDERVQTSTVDWTITAESGATVEKFVKGSAGDGEWTTEDVSIAALADDDSDETSGTDVDYRIQVTNTASNDLTDIVVYDILPYVGDTGIGASLAGDSRGSEFQVDFRTLLGALPDGVSVEYSTSENPTREELFPDGQPAGADDDWTSTLPADPSTVRALRFTIDSLAPGEETTVDYRGVVPEFTWGASDQVCQAETPLKAWNNVAFQATTLFADGSERTLLPAEAPRVSIREVCGQIGDYAWYDTNRDGLQGDDEKPVEGVVFQLLDGDGNPVLDDDGNPITATTDENGYYSFDVPVGDWSVQVIEVPDSYVFTTPNAGDDDAADSDIAGLNQPSAPVSITPDHLVDDTLDAGVLAEVSVGDFVWADLDGDGLQDDGEPGISGVELTLVGPDGNPVTDVNGNPVEPVVTDENGGYSFEHLPMLEDGQSYTVKVTETPEGYTPTKPGQGDRDEDSSTGEAPSEGLTTPGERDDTLDFGFVPVGEIGDYVWIDTDNDGIQDDGEPGVPGVVFQLLDENGDPVLDDDGDPITATTDENGYYLFSDLPLGTWSVQIIEVPEGYGFTIPNAGDDDAVDSDALGLNTPFDPVTLTFDDRKNHTLDAGLVPTVQVGDYVWVDTDGDGIQDDGEPGIENVVLKLVGPDGQPVVDVHGNPVEPTTTDENGKYLFSDLPLLQDGESYTVLIDREETLKVNPEFGKYLPTTSNTTDREHDSDEWQADSEGLTEPGQSDLTLDFGFVVAAPEVDIEKVDAEGNDADTKDESVTLPDGGTPLVFTVTNEGNERLVDVTVSDELIEGTGEIAGLVCTFPDGSTGTTWAGPFEIGASFDCAADLSGVEPGTVHRDRATVVGTGEGSGEPVSDEDDYNADRPSEPTPTPTPTPTEPVVTPTPSEPTPTPTPTPTPDVPTPTPSEPTPSVPDIDVEKLDVNGNDADTKQESAHIQGGSVELTFVVTNTGGEVLTDVSVSDRITAGSAKVEDLVCTFPDGSAGTTWAGPFAVGDSFTCSATLTGLVAGEQHTDVVTVNGTGEDSGTKVRDDDAYNAIRNPGLTATGGQVAPVLFAAAGVLLLGGWLILIRRSRHRAGRSDLG